ncbi:putative alkaline shock family protein YloU [Streptomyces sp. 3330]|uniref:Asp23/Gls24 family envelope stress response protein n=1 Tax=Streptomyces sp. 3330 TaxID=2817755 RepID=UPI00286707E1|nr:Asp23/Gls24 family envelope stress response protein [Streptomyces sp. 3330]MDR6976978.1 putative alkaline shock family protein YloU [Streptomyces sp. 3330]
MTENTGVKVGGPPGSRGRTIVADVVVEKIAGMAARDVLGVYALGGGLARSMGAMRERLPGAGSGKSATRGVSVEVGELQAAIDLELVVDYGVSITDVAAEVRENVISAVERMAGREVVEVNITVSDVKLPADEEDEGEERQRIQ